MLMLKIYTFIVCLFFTSISFAATHRPEDFLKQISGVPNEGSQIVAHFCASCHAAHPLISMGAPRIANTQDWQPRLKQGLKSLFSHVDQGINAMPPRGGCFECTDTQLLLAIKSMLRKEDQNTLFKYKKNH